jgi:hypothetical protein
MDKQIKFLQERDFTVLDSDEDNTLLINEELSF